MVWNPFKKRVAGVYDPNKPRMKLNFIPVIAVVILSLIGIWALSYLFGNWMGLAPVGPVMLLVLFGVTIIFSLVIVKRRWEQREVSSKDFYLIMVLVILLVLGYVFLPDLAPELFEQAIMSFKTEGLQAMLP